MAGSGMRMSLTQVAGRDKVWQLDKRAAAAVRLRSSVGSPTSPFPPQDMGERPSHLPPGTPLGDHYTVEGLVRLSEGRMFYLANDVRPDVSTRRCWHCGHTESLRSMEDCEHCGTPFQDRRFLISARWVPERFEAYERYFRKRITHPGIARPIDVFSLDGVLFSVTAYGGEGLMVDEAAPLRNARLLHLGQRIVGTLAYLHAHGVRLMGLNRANLLVSPDNSVQLYEPRGGGDAGERLRDSSGVKGPRAHQCGPAPAAVLRCRGGRPHRLHERDGVGAV